MHVGTAVIFQNPGETLSDQAVYRRDVRLARLAEPLGFESVWSVEHHFTDYTMCPDPLQFLTDMAGCTTQVKLGTMVVVLTWHDPLPRRDHRQLQVDWRRSLCRRVFLCRDARRGSGT